MRKYVIMGIQGSGKGTQAKMLANLDLVHISVGDIFRWNVQNHTKMGAQVRRTMAAGELVGDDQDLIPHADAEPLRPQGSHPPAWHATSTTRHRPASRLPRHGHLSPQARNT